MQIRVLFHRDFRYLTGGHLKVWDYFRHVQSFAGYRAQIYFSPVSTWDESNPWLPIRDQVLEEWRPDEADIRFLAGRDWDALTAAQRVRSAVPVVNLIQHVRHADPLLPLYQYLHYPAVRICVSRPVAAAIEATGRVNGPIRVIENGVDRSGFPTPRPWEERTCDVLICGYKQPALAEELAARLTRRLSADLEVRALTAFMPRDRFLDALADARVAVCLPRVAEGFYLPALEAMIQGALVVCPDCVGNRDFCLDGRTCWVPDWSLDAIEHAVIEALSASASHRRKLQQAVDQLVSYHSLDRERQAFRGILAQLDELWEQTRNVG